MALFGLGSKKSSSSGSGKEEQVKKETELQEARKLESVISKSAQEQETAQKQQQLQKTISETQQVTTGTEATTQKQVGETQQVSEQQAATTSLDLETQDFIKSLIGGLEGGIGGDIDSLLSQLAGTITERAQTAEADIQAQISPIISAQRLTGEQELQALQTQLAQQSGGSIDNTLVASATSVGRANLEAQLAKTQGELNLAARSAATAELVAATAPAREAEGLAFQQEQAPITNIANLLNILKGATVEQTQAGATGTTQQTVAETQAQKESTAETKAATSTETAMESLIKSLTSAEASQDTESVQELSRLLDSLVKGTRSSVGSAKESGFKLSFGS